FIAVRVYDLFRLQHAVIVNRLYRQARGIGHFFGQKLKFIVIDERAMARRVDCRIVQRIERFEDQAESGRTSLKIVTPAAVVYKVALRISRIGAARVEGVSSSLR